MEDKQKTPNEAAQDDGPGEEEGKTDEKPMKQDDEEDEETSHGDKDHNIPHLPHVTPKDKKDQKKNEKNKKAPRREDSDDRDPGDDDDSEESSKEETKLSESDSWDSAGLDDEDGKYWDTNRYIDVVGEKVNVTAMRKKYKGYTHKKLNKEYNRVFNILKREEHNNRLLSTLLADQLNIDPKTAEKTRTTDSQYELELREFTKFTVKIYDQCKAMSQKTRRMEKTVVNVQNELDDKRKEFVEAVTSLISKAKTKCPRPGDDLEKLLEKTMMYEKKATATREKCVYSQMLHALLQQEVEEWRKGGSFDFANLEELEKETRNLMDKLDIQNAYMARMKKQMMSTAQSLAHIRMKSAGDIEAAVRQDEKIAAINQELDEIWTKTKVSREERKAVERHIKNMTEDTGLHKYPLLVENFKEINNKVVQARKEIQALEHLLERKSATGRSTTRKGVKFKLESD